MQRRANSRDRDRNRDRDRDRDRPRGRGRQADRDRSQGRDSPFGRWEPPRRSNPFGGPPRRRPPRDPFAGAAAESGEAGGSRQRRGRRRPPAAPPLDLRLEIAADGTVAHLPELPGCTFRAGDPVQVLRVAVEHVAGYVQWCEEEGLGDLNPRLAELVPLVAGGRQRQLQVIEQERRDGAALWLSGQPAVLFRSDYRAHDDDAVRAHLRFMRAVARRIRIRVASLTPAQCAWKPAADRRSLDETLEHLATLCWWFCARLDDELPEPPQPGDEGGLAAQLAARIDEAEAFLLAVPAAQRSVVHLPGRHPSADPAERWTHTKVCRRQAEHLWEHLVGIPRAVQSAAEAALPRPE